MDSSPSPFGFVPRTWDLVEKSQNVNVEHLNHVVLKNQDYFPDKNHLYGFLTTNTTYNSMVYVLYAM